MKQFLLSAAAVAVMAGGASASTMGTTSVNIDFVALVASIGEQGVEGETFNFNGLDVMLSSTADAYLDDVSRGLPSGLGVCSIGLDAADQCMDPSDDHVTVASEVITITFGEGVDTMSDFVFRGRQHVDLTGTAGALTYSLSDAGGVLAGQASTFGSLESDIEGSAIPPIFSFSLSAVTEAFYLSSFTVTYTPAPVPLPASVLLLGGALAGVGALKRRKKA